MISIYSDGSSGGNSLGAIGWGFVIVKDGVTLSSGSGGNKIGTNNISELTASIEGMKAFKELELSDEVELVSDSQYVLGLANGNFKPTKNLELAKEIRGLAVELNVKTRWVKGHSGDEFNEKCDELAKAAKLMYSDEVKTIKKVERRTRRQKIKDYKKRMRNDSWR